MSAHSDRLVDVVAATMEVAAEAGHSGTFTDEVAQVLAAVVGKVAERTVDAAVLDGFVSGWQEAVQAMDSEGGPSEAQVLRIHHSNE
ncbi:hypothetical protein [Streptomyces luteireticuli]|uniref:hypothetical protein n=1 Tax=Streptomyces luteireticuli TaxID=173858 RepID=UPI003556BE70